MTSWLCDSCNDPTSAQKVFINFLLQDIILLAKLYQFWSQGKIELYPTPSFYQESRKISRTRSTVHFYLRCRFLFGCASWSEILLKTFSETHRQDLNSILIKFPPKKLYCFRFRVQRFDCFKVKDPSKDKNFGSLNIWICTKVICTSVNQLVRSSSICLSTLPWLLGKASSCSLFTWLFLTNYRTLWDLLQVLMNYFVKSFSIWLHYFFDSFQDPRRKMDLSRLEFEASTALFLLIFNIQHINECAIIRPRNTPFFTSFLSMLSR